MKVCIAGAGAIGGYLGVKLTLCGESVTLIDRGVHLAAIKKNGLKLVMQDGTEYSTRDLRATDNMEQVGPQDVVILGFKAHQIEAAARGLRALFDRNTVVVTVQNGIPWWYFYKHGGPFEGQVIHAVDPHGIISAHIEPERIIGCVAYPACEIVQPGIIHHIEGNRFPIGELDGIESDRVQAVSAVLVKAGFKSHVLRDVRSEIWLKLWGALVFNPVSALTHATLADICCYPATRQLAVAMMTEAQTIAGKLGISFRVPMEQRIEGAHRVGHHKTSMLKDVESGDYLEIEAILGAVVELGVLTGTSTPCLDAIYACTKLLAETIREKGICIREQLLCTQ